MSVRGGYQIIDLKNTDFTSGSPVTIPGTYATIEASHKRCAVEGFSIANVEYKPMSANFVVNASNYVAQLTDKISISVTAEDAVTITVAE